MSDKKNFLMIDGSSLIFRAFYAIRDLRTADGIYTNGVYGFLNMYWKALEEIKPDYIAVAFDRSEPSFRKQDYREYKANRQETPDELRTQFGILKDLLKLMGVKILDRKGFEADDIIGSLSKIAEDEGINSYLLTGDRDYYQLVSDMTTVLYTKKGISLLEKVDPAYIYDKFQLKPQDLIEVKGLQGDTSDNIPGVPGVGEKTALKLIRAYGNLEGVYENLDEISGKKLKENLLDNKDIAFMSRKLGTIIRSLDFDEDIEDFKPGSIDKEELADRFRTLEFRSFEEKFFPDKAENKDVFNAHLVEPQDWPKLAEKTANSKQVAMAILSDGENYIHSNPAFCVWYVEGESCLLELKGNEDKFKAEFSHVFNSEKPEIMAYDVKESLVLLKKLGIDFKAKYEDIMLMEYLIDPNRANYKISNLAEKELGLTIEDREGLLGKGKKRKEFDQVDREKLLSYCGGLMTAIVRAEEILRGRLKELDMIKLYDQIENPLAKVLADMESDGIAVDEKVLSELEIEYKDKLKSYEDEIYDYAGYTFNINSTQQLSKLLFEDLGLKPGKKTKTGYSTSADVLEKMRRDHPIIGAILNYRSMAKLISTYIDGFKPYIDGDSRVRSTFRQNVTATGRISSTEPNLQNIPVRSDEGRKLRKVFVAGPGKTLIDADYSQIELRVLAALSQDRTMIGSFKAGLDIHRKTAAEVTGKDIGEVTDLERSRAKAVNFGIIYGISDYGLSQDLGISRKEAGEYIETYKNTYPEIKKYMSDIVEKANEQGYVETYYGRRREIPELKSKNWNIRQFGERIALNTPIQGTAADIIKLAMIKVDDMVKKYGDKAKLVLQIHDELIVEADQKIAEDLAVEMEKIMEGVSQFDLALPADTNIGKSWYEAK